MLKYSILIAAFSICLLTKAQNFKNGSFEVKVPWNKDFNAQVSYKNGVPDGQWKIISPGMVGMDTTTYSYQNGKLNGTLTITNNEGTIVRKTGYQENEINGKDEIFSFKGETISFYTYAAGKRQGVFHDLDKTASYDSGFLHGFCKGKSNYNRTEYEGYFEHGNFIGTWKIKRGSEFYIINFENNEIEGPYEKFMINKDDSLQLVETGNIRQGYLHGTQKVYRGDTFPYRIWMYNLGRQCCVNKTFNSDGSLKELSMLDTLGYKWIKKEWFYGGALSSETTTKDSVTTHKKYWENGKLQEVSTYAISITPQYHKYYDSFGVLRHRDTFYTKNGKRYYDDYSFKNGVLSAEKHAVENLRVGRWFSEGRWDGKYVNGKFVGQCSKEWELMNTPDGDSYFNPQWLSSGPINPIKHLTSELPNGGNIFKYIDTSEYRFNSLISESERKNVVSNIKKNDTLNLSGDIIFKCFVNSTGTICSPTLIKGLHPFYDNAILQQLLWRTVRAEQGIKPDWIELKYTFKTF